MLVSVLGFVLEGDPALREEVLDSALGRIPVIGAQLADDVQPLTGSAVALVLGFVGALWAGLGVTVALGSALDEIWGVPRLERRGVLRARGRGLVVLVVLGAALVAASAAAGLATGGGIGPAAQRLGALAAALAVDVAIFLAGFWLLTAHERSAGALLPGVVVAAVGSLILQAAGGWYVDATVTRASDTYGTFAVVIGLMSWFFLMAHLVLFAAEINVVRTLRLWPRALTGELAPADREALRLTAAAARADARTEIDVRFTDGEVPGVHATPASHRTAPLPSVRDGRRIGPELDHSTRSAHMSTLVAIAYPDRGTAEQVRQELIQATKEHLVRLEDAVVVEHQQDGKIKLHQAMSTTGAGAAGGALWGGLIGLIFLAPLFGMAVGAASGAVAGKVSDVGVNDNFMKDLGNKLPPGGAALIALGSTDARDKLIERLRQYGGEVIQTSLGSEEEAQLKAALGEPAASS